MPDSLSFRSRSDAPDALPEEQSGPRGAPLSLRARGSSLASPEAQLALLEGIDLAASMHAGEFPRALASAGRFPLRPERLEIFQVNLGKLCNMSCRHCHVDAGPDRTDSMMDRETIEACLRALDLTGAHTVDVTGGAPELSPHFRYLVDESVKRGKHVLDRCNLTVLLVPSLQDLPKWLAQRGVEIVASLPHPRRRGTDAQRGDGTFEKSLEAMKRLNSLGYGSGRSDRTLTLVANPIGAFLPASQASMEREWKEAFRREHGVGFDRLITLTDMPISRYLEWLEASGNLESYLKLLVDSFNPETVSGLMCRNTISVSWDGSVYDCDFNQMLELPAVSSQGRPLNVRSLDPDVLAVREIVTRRHCFGCTAGAGSSCGGTI
jgi:radical SAM/Cys-rich protein